MLMTLYASAGCGTIPNALAIFRSARFYKRQPLFLGVQGSLSKAQGEAIVSELEHKSGSSDILSRHLAFEQAISSSLPIAENHVTPLNHASEVYPTMSMAIRSSHANINLETYIFADDNIGSALCGCADRKAGDTDFRSTSSMTVLIRTARHEHFSIQCAPPAFTFLSSIRLLRGRRR